MMITDMSYDIKTPRQSSAQNPYNSSHFTQEKAKSLPWPLRSHMTCTTTDPQSLILSLFCIPHYLLSHTFSLVRCLPQSTSCSFGLKSSLYSQVVNFLTSFKFSKVSTIKTNKETNSTILLTTVTTQCITSQGLYPLTNISHFPLWRL